MSKYIETVIKATRQYGMMNRHSEESGEINLKYHGDGYEEMIKVVYVRTNKNSLFSLIHLYLIIHFQKVVVLWVR